jgi:hypothetical protein
MTARPDDKAEVTKVSEFDREKLMFDGTKADLYINTGQLGGNHFLVKVAKPDGTPLLIAVHL